MTNCIDQTTLTFTARSANEGFARSAAACYAAQLDPTLDEIADIKTAVSEAVTNSIIHGYENLYGYGRPGGQETEAREKANPGKVRLRCVLEKNILHIEVADSGKGIEDVERAMEPLYTTKPELERSGMGFAFMEAFMDDLEVESAPGQGTKVRMIKKIGVGGWIEHQC